MSRSLWALLLIISLAGCGRGDKDKDKDADKDKDVAKKKEEKKAPKTGPAPPAKGFPPDIPGYPEAELVSAATPEEGFTGKLSSGDPIAKILAYYEEHLPGKGWKVTSSTPGAAFGQLDGVKGEVVLALDLVRAGKTTEIAFAVTRGIKKAEVDPKKKEVTADLKLRGLPLHIDFPADVPLYPESLIEGSKADYVAMKTTARIDKVGAYFATNLRSLGWKETMRDLGDSILVVEAEKMDRALRIEAIQDEIDTVINIAVGKKKVEEKKKEDEKEKKSEDDKKE